jgi:hypothetical protein
MVEGQQGNVIDRLENCFSGVVSSQRVAIILGKDIGDGYEVASWVPVWVGVDAQ